MHEELMAKIKAEGIGAGSKWMTMAGSAMAGNKAAQAECARLMGRNVESMGDYWQIMLAASEAMTPGEMGMVAGEAAQALAAGKSAANDADAYIANRLSALRRARGLTQQQLSAKSSVGISTLQKLENGANRILGARTEIVLKIAKALGVTVEELAGGTMKKIFYSRVDCNGQMGEINEAEYGTQFDGDVTAYIEQNIELDELGLELSEDDNLGDVQQNFGPYDPENICVIRTEDGSPVEVWFAATSAN